MKFLSKLTIIANVVFAFWILFNAIDSGFKGTFPEKASGIILIILLVLNTKLIYKQNR